MLQYVQNKRSQLSSYLEVEVLDDTLVVDKLLGHETGSGDHGEAAVVELLVLEVPELGGVAGLETERVETDIAGDVLGTEEAGPAEGDVLRLDPPLHGPRLLGGADPDGEKTPEEGRDLLEVIDGGPRDGGIEEEGRALDRLPDEATEGGEPGHASVSDFGFTVPLQGVLVGLLGEAKRVPDAEGGNSTRDGVNGELRGLQ